MTFNEELLLLKNIQQTLSVFEESVERLQGILIDSIARIQDDINDREDDMVLDAQTMERELKIEDVKDMQKEMYANHD